jgi:hypothetical protein
MDGARGTPARRPLPPLAARWRGPGRLLSQAHRGLPLWRYVLLRFEGVRIINPGAEAALCLRKPGPSIRICRQMPRRCRADELTGSHEQPNRTST